jgi:hypothetical protein
MKLVTFTTSKINTINNEFVEFFLKIYLNLTLLGI